MEFSRWDVREHAQVASVPASHDWFSVRDETGAAGSFLIRVARNGAGRLIITGLLLGDGIEQVDANVLRSIQPAEILRVMDWRNSGSLPPRSVGEVSPVSGLARWEGLSAAVEDLPHDPPDASRGRRGPSNDNLAHFASVYLRHLSYTSRAMAATHRELHMSRATANRWAARCRDLGLIPPGGRADA